MVKHLFEHNMGVTDMDFISKLPNFGNQLGRKYQLQKMEVLGFVEGI